MAILKINHPFSKTLPLIFCQLLLGLCIGLFSANTFADPIKDFDTAKEAYGNDDWMTAIIHLRKSAEAGHPPAMVLLGFILDRGEEDVEAIGWYRKAAMLNSAEGALGLGHMLANGFGVKKDEKEGIKWIVRSAKLGHHPAMMRLAKMHQVGEMGVETDMEQTKKWLSLAAKDGFAPAIYELELIRQNDASNHPQKTLTAKATETQRYAPTIKDRTETKTVAKVVSDPTPIETLSPEENIKSLIKQWAGAWSDKNPDVYFGSYSNTYQPPSKYRSKDVWKKRWLKAIQKNKSIQVTIEDLKVILIDTNNARALVDQHFKSDHYQDQTRKTLSLRQENGQWKIVREESKIMKMR